MPRDNIRVRRGRGGSLECKEMETRQEKRVIGTTSEKIITRCGGKKKWEGDSKRKMEWAIRVERGGTMSRRKEREREKSTRREAQGL